MINLEESDVIIERPGSDAQGDENQAYAQENDHKCINNMDIFFLGQHGVN